MTRAPITTLFTEVPATGQGPSGVAVSFLVHCLVIGGSFYTIHHAPRILEPNLVEEAPVRLLTLNRPMVVQRDFGVFGRPASVKAKTAPQHGSSGGRKVATAHPRLEMRVEQAPQTLVDPILKPEVVLKIRTPLPNVVLWKPEPLMVKEVQPSVQQPTAANVKSALTPPNHEPDLADIQISSAPGATEKLAMVPSTTAPVTVVRPTPTQQAPQTTSVPEKPPAPAAVVSITEYKMDKGTTALPPANQVASSMDVDSLRAGKAATGTAEANQNPVVVASGSGTGKDAGEHGNQTGRGDGIVAPDKVPDTGTPGSSALSNPPTKVVGNNGTADGGLATDGAETGVHISLPADGRYGAVVVGSSITDAFPETEGIMADRLTYTVYLQVGLPRAWIMQYSLPESSERGVNTIRPDAPFPYEIYRPKISGNDVTTDAILVHGLVNAAGHFEQLEIVYPHRYVKTKSFLANLEKWQFRPAMQQGLATAVEVLLIVPVG